MDHLEYDEFYRFHCPDETILPKRYEPLRKAADKHKSSKIKYFFALDQHNNIEVLPRLIGTLIQVIKMLGPEHCAVSMVGGSSTDGTDEMLGLIKKHLFEKGGVNSWVQYSTLNFA